MTPPLPWYFVPDLPDDLAGGPVLLFLGVCEGWGAILSTVIATTEPFSNALCCNHTA